MKIHQSNKKWTQESPANDSRMSPEHEASHEPLRLTRVVTSTLPTSLIAERIYVDNPYPEPPEQIPLQSGLRNSQRRPAKNPGRTLHETTDKHRHLHWADGPEEMQQQKQTHNHSSRCQREATGWEKGLDTPSARGEILHIMISEGSCDTTSNDAENSTWHHWNELHFK